MSWRSAAAWVAAFAALIVLAYDLIDTHTRDQPATQRPAGAQTSPRTVKVLRAVDGDTILVRATNGNTERVRYIGVDTPESVKPDTPVECFGHEASEYNRSLVQGRSVRLVSDREAQDKYGRTLAFVYVGGTLVNAELIKHGYARTLEIEPNTSKARYFASLERVAIRTNQGLWKACSR